MVVPRVGYLVLSVSSCCWVALCAGGVSSSSSDISYISVVSASLYSAFAIFSSIPGACSSRLLFLGFVFCWGLLARVLSLLVSELWLILSSMHLTI